MCLEFPNNKVVFVCFSPGPIPLFLVYVLLVTGIIEGSQQDLENINSAGTLLPDRPGSCLANFFT